MILKENGKNYLEDKEREIIAEYRAENNLSQRKMGEMLGYDERTFSKILKGKLSFNQKLRENFKEQFGLEFDFIKKIEPEIINKQPNSNEVILTFASKTNKEDIRSFRMDIDPSDICSEGREMMSMISEFKKYMKVDLYHDYYLVKKEYRVSK